MLSIEKLQFDITVAADHFDKGESVSLVRSGGVLIADNLRSFATS